MTGRVLFAAALCCGLIGCSTREEARATAALFAEAGGDSVAGQAAFLELECTTCHTVEGCEEFPHPLAVVESFPLTRAFGERSAVQIADSMIFPSHEIEPGGESAGTTSRMGDSSESMTVRQLIDLIAFFQSLGE